jgi:hypothetical protein
MNLIPSPEPDSEVMARLRADMPDVADDTQKIIDGASALCARGVLSAEHFEALVALVSGDVVDEWIARAVAKG